MENRYMYIGNSTWNINIFVWKQLFKVLTWIQNNFFKNIGFCVNIQFQIHFVKYMCLNICHKNTRTKVLVK